MYVILDSLPEFDRANISMKQSGLSLSGVVMSTIYRLFDLDFNIYVIADTVLEPMDHNADVSKVMLDILLPKTGVQVISLDQALHAL